MTTFMSPNGVLRQLHGYNLAVRTPFTGFATCPSGQADHRYFENDRSATTTKNKTKHNPNKTMTEAVSNMTTTLMLNDTQGMKAFTGEMTHSIRSACCRPSSVCQLYISLLKSSAAVPCGTHPRRLSSGSRQRHCTLHASLPCGAAPAPDHRLAEHANWR